MGRRRIALKQAGRLARVVEQAQNIGSAADGADGKAPANDLAECRQVGSDSAIPLIAAAADAEANDFVQDQHHIVLVSDLFYGASSGGF